MLHRVSVDIVQMCHVQISKLKLIGIPRPEGRQSIGKVLYMGRKTISTSVKLFFFEAASAL